MGVCWPPRRRTSPSCLRTTPPTRLNRYLSTCLSLEKIIYISLTHHTHSYVFSADHWKHWYGVQRDGPRLQAAHPPSQKDGTGWLKSFGKLASFTLPPPGLLPYVSRDDPHGAAGVQSGTCYAGVHPVWRGIHHHHVTILTSYCIIIRQFLP